MKEWFRFFQQHKYISAESLDLIQPREPKGYKLIFKNLSNLTYKITVIKIEKQLNLIKKEKKIG